MSGDNLTIVAAALVVLIVVVRVAFYLLERWHRLRAWRPSDEVEQPPARRRTLVCMRLADMVMVHPDQIARACERSGETVGIYPSGQQVLSQFHDTEIVCHHCCASGEFRLAPGALDEPFQSVRRP